MKIKAESKPVVDKLNGPSKSIKGLPVLDEEAFGWVGVSDRGPQSVAGLLQGRLQLRLPVRCDCELCKVVPSRLEASGAAGKRKEPIFEEREGRVSSNMNNNASISTLLSSH